MGDKPKRRWYQIGFSIRDLMWLTLLVAVLLAWGRENRRTSLILDQVLQEQEKERQQIVRDMAELERKWQDQRAKVVTGYH